MKIRYPAHMALLDALDRALIDGLINLTYASTGSHDGEEEMDAPNPAAGGDDEKA